MAAGKTKIRVLPYRAVVIDGALRAAGEELEVPAADAKALIAEGYADKA